jgi:hypothetical protein
MPLSLQHRYAMLLADRTRDVRTITTVITEVMAANPETTPLDIETALRAATAQAYLVANSTTAGCRAPWKTAPSASRGIAPSSDS